MYIFFSPIVLSSANQKNVICTLYFQHQFVLISPDIETSSVLFFSMVTCLPLFIFRQKDLENFLDHTRNKFVGFDVKNDHNSLAGLPQPIHEGVKVLKQV